MPSNSGVASDPLRGLSPAVKGCVLTLALSAAGGAAGDGSETQGAAAALVGPDAAVCRAALAALAALDRTERARAIARLLRAARAPVPEGIERVHPGWLRAALEPEASPILHAITDGLAPEVQAVAREIIEARNDTDAVGSSAVVDAGSLAELGRAVFAGLAPMPPVADADRADAPGWLRLAALPVPALLVEIERRGATTLGTSLVGAPPAIVARAAAQAGDSALAAVVLASARQSSPTSDRASARALVAGAAQVGARELGSMLTVGLLALAGELAAPAASADAARVIAQRLPPRLGRILLEATKPAVAEAQPGALA